MLSLAARTQVVVSKGASRDQRVWKHFHFACFYERSLSPLIYSLVHYLKWCQITVQDIEFDVNMVVQILL